MTEPTKIRITETRLSDGSLVYGLRIGSEEIACINEDIAYDLAKTIEASTVDTEFDGWDFVKRVA